MPACVASNRYNIGSVIEFDPQLSPVQLSLPLYTAPVDRRVRIYRENAWPEGAPSPDVMRTRATRLLRRADAGLPATARSLSRLVVTANRIPSVTLSRPDDRVYTARVHWTIVDDPEFTALFTRALSGGGFMRTRIRELLDRASQRIGPLGIYDAAATKSSHEPRHIDLEAVYQSALTHLPQPDRGRGLKVTWGRKAIRKGGSLRLGSLRNTTGEIRLHPVLDDATIPPFVVEYVMYHEICHWVAPPLTESEARRNGEHRVHHRAFRALEALYPKAGVAQAWIDKYIDTLLRRAVA